MKLTVADRSYSNKKIGEILITDSSRLTVNSNSETPQYTNEKVKGITGKSKK